MTGRRTRLRSILATAVLVSALVGCSTAPPDRATEGALGGTVTVLAAASLTESFEALAETFEAAHPSVDLRLSFGGSALLAQQVRAGATADVLATADERTMRFVADDGLIDEPHAIARNTLTLVTAAGNPAGIQGLPDLARDDLVVALCDAVVPCGDATMRLLSLADVDPAPDTLEQDVKAVLMKVRLGEADVGVVYVTDAFAAGSDVTSIRPVEAAAVENVAMIGLITGAPNPEAAEAWIRFVLGPDGQEVLADAGFDAP